MWWHSFHFVLLFLVASQALAWPPTYGPEFEFSSSYIRRNFQGGMPKKLEADAARDFARAVEAKCQETKKCKVREIHGKWNKDYIVIFEDGWWFQVSYDPAVVEIQAKAQTRAEIASRVGLMDEYIFAVGKSLNMDPIGETGHFNIGALSAFDDNPKAMMSFFLDYSNHPELALGIFHTDLNNAPPVAVLKEEQKRALVKLARSVAQNEVGSLRGLARRVMDEVYTWTPTWSKTVGERVHYQAVGMKHLAKYDFPEKDYPIELRSMRMQKNAEDFLLLAELMEKRIEFLKERGHPLVYVDKGNVRHYNPQELAGRFYAYIQDMGLEWERYARLGEFSKDTKLDPFVVGEVKWKDRAYLRAAQSYAEDIVGSPWLRSRLLEALKHPEALTSGNGIKILEATSELIKPDMSPELALDLKGFFNEALGLQSWRVSGNLKKKLATLDIKTKGLFASACHNLFSHLKRP